MFCFVVLMKLSSFAILVSWVVNLSENINGLSLLWGRNVWQANFFVHVKMTLGLPLPSTVALKMFWISHTPYIHTDTQIMARNASYFTNQRALQKKIWPLMVNYIWNGRLWVDYKNLLENTDVSCLVWCPLTGLGSYAHVHYKKQFLSCMTSLCCAYVTVTSNSMHFLSGLGSSIAVRTPSEDLRDI